MSGKHRYVPKHRAPKQNIQPRFSWALPAVAGLALATAAFGHKTEAKVAPVVPAAADSCSILFVHDVPGHAKRDHETLDRVDAGLGLDRKTAKSLGHRAVSVTLKHIGEKPQKALSTLYMDHGIPTASMYMPLNQPEGTEAVISIQPPHSGAVTCNTSLVFDGGEWHRMTLGEKPLRSAEQQPTVPPKIR